MFDPEELLNAQASDANQTRMDPVPEGEYQAIIEDVQASKIGDKEIPVLNVRWKIEDPELAQRLNRQEVQVRQTVFLDIDESGSLATGANKNIQLGRLREAVGQNKKGQPWSPRNLIGAGPALVSVTHRQDKNDPEIVYDQVQRVAPLK